MQEEHGQNMLNDLTFLCLRLLPRNEAK